MRFDELAAAILLSLYGGRRSTGYFRQYARLMQMPWYTGVMDPWTGDWLDDE